MNRLEEIENRIDEIDDELELMREKSLGDLNYEDYKDDFDGYSKLITKSYKKLQEDSKSLSDESRLLTYELKKIN